MRILDRYVLRELVVPFWIGISVGVLLLVGTTLVNYARDIITRGVPLGLVLKLLVLKIPEFAVIAMPMAMAFAASLAINRLTRQGEITPMRMAGIRFWRILTPLIIAGLAGGLFSWVMAEKAGPWANKRANSVIQRIWMQSLVTSSQSPAFVRTVDGTGDYTLYIGRLTRTGEGNFHLENALTYVIPARGARHWLLARDIFVNRRVWTFSQVIRRTVDRDGLTQDETHFSQWTHIFPDEVDFIAGAKQANEMTGRELLAQVRMLRKSGAGNIARLIEMEYHNRLALPFACLIFSLVAAPISFRFARGGTFVGVLVSIVCGFLYWNIMLLDKILGESGVLPTLAAAWLQNIAFGALAAYLVQRVG